MSRMSRLGTADIRTTAAALLSLAPGFLLPFVFSWRLTPSDSDTMLLALTVLTTFISTVSVAIELNTVSEFGRTLTENTVAAEPQLRSYTRRVSRFGVLAAAIIWIVLTLIYSSSMGEWSADFFIMTLLMLIAPVISIYSGIQSGKLIAGGRAAASISSQFLRPLPPLLLLLIVPAPAPWLIPLLFGFGEFARWYLLKRVCARTFSELRPTSTESLQTRGLTWQASSVTMSQGAPLVDRSFLASASAGSVSMYELADKFFFAAIQMLNYGLLSRRVGRWSRIPSNPRTNGAVVLRRDLSVLFAASIAVALLGTAGLALLSMFPLPELWAASTSWGMMLMASVPLTMWIMSASRLVVIARKQEYLLWFSLGTVVFNLMLDIIFFSFIGPFGIIVATVATRGISAIAYALVVWKAILPTLFSRDSDVDPSPRESQR